jgi:hypothetical protein
MLFPLVNLLLAIANLIILGILLRKLKRIKPKDPDRPPLRRLHRFSKKTQPAESKAIGYPKTKKLIPSLPLAETTTTTSVVAPDAPKEDREEIAAEKEQVDVWNIVRASVRGTGHIKNDIPCQDYNYYELLKGETVIAAVADGLGSASKADEGAKLAVDTFLSVAKMVLGEEYPASEVEWVDVMAHGFRQARVALERQSQNKGLKLKEYATTLIAIILTEDWLVTGQIGDGGAVVLVENNQLLTISPPQRGEYANHVFPLTMPDALDVAKFSARNVKVQAAALFTDGIQHLALNNGDDSPHPPFFTQIFEELPTIKNCEKESRLLAEHLTSERVSSRTDDDKTLLLIGRKNI